MRAFVRFLAVAAMLAVPLAQAQELKLRSPEIRGRVVDEAGAPVPGAVVVARWNLLFYVAKFEGSGWYPNGDALHVGEAVTDRDGRYAIAAWGPKARPNARLQENAPTFHVFKGGYEPSTGRTPNVSLRRAAAEDTAYAERVRSFQEGPLAWYFPGGNWKSMPRMVAAVQAEKVRLGATAKAMRGPNTIPGRSGEGRIIDAQTKQAVRTGVIAVAWTLKRIDGAPGSRRFVHARRIGTDQPDVEFYVSPYRLPGPRLPAGWEINPDVPPDLTIYSVGYRPQRVARWSEAGGIVTIERMPEAREGTLAYLRAVRADLDRELAAGDREIALEGERVLLSDFGYECAKLVPELRRGLCYEAGSEMDRYIEASRRNPVMLVERWDGIEEIRVVARPAAAPQAHAVAAQGYYPPQRIPVSGFSIEPVKR